MTATATRADGLPGSASFLDGMRELLVDLPPDSCGLGLKVLGGPLDAEREMVLVYPRLGRLRGLSDLHSLTWYEVNLNSEGFNEPTLLSEEEVETVIQTAVEDLRRR